MAQGAIYPGTFDPVTNGHIDVIRRAAHIFDHVIIAVPKTRNAKNTLFSLEERIEILKEVTLEIPRVSVECFEGLATEFARQKKIKVLIRGLRMISDFEYEFQMALTNRRLAEDIETVFLMPSEQYSFLSSTLLKEVASYGANISSFVPSAVEVRLKERLKK